MNISILGAGTWGTALARVFFNKGYETTLYSVIASEIDNLKSTHKHPNLPDMILPEGIRLTSDIQEACESADYIVFAVPSVYLRGTAEAAAPYISPDQILIDVAKGIESDTLMTMTEIIGSILPGNKVVALSGPTHAEEVSIDMPTTIIAACADENTAVQVAELFYGTCIRAYTNTDVKGVELSGAVKNIIALAAGVAAGLGYGDNCKAALITRGIAEIKRLGLAMGCDEPTFSGLAGIGDLIVTATSMHSRNNRCGMLIGHGMNIAEATKEVGMVVEGLNALPAAIKLCEKYGIEMPITQGLDYIVTKGVEPRKVVDMLMSRPMKNETE